MRKKYKWCDAICKIALICKIKFGRHKNTKNILLLALKSAFLFSSYESAEGSQLILGLHTIKCAH